MTYGEFAEYADFIYESNRDEANLDPDAESAYQQRKWRKLQKSFGGDQ
jgi:hypothetical protein